MNLITNRPGPLTVFASAILCSALIFSGCSDNLGANADSQHSLSLSISIPVTTGQAAAKSGAGFAGYVLSDSTNTLDITYVGIVLREIELERVDATDCDSLASDSGDDDHDACEEFEAGPMLLEPALDGSVEHVVAVDVPDGVYDEIEFDIHKVGDDSPEEIAFVTDHPEFAGISIRVEGTYNDSSFVFTQDLDEEQEIEFTDPITVDALTGTDNITINMDLATWFVGNDGMLVDPALANKGEAFEGQVEENIKRSIDAFEDDDHDGHEDDESDDS